MRKYLSSAAAVLISAGVGASAQVVNGPVGWTSATNGVVQLTTFPGYSTTNAVYTGTGTTITQIGTIEPVPPNALYHQVVDRYFDAAGQEVETRSATHVVGYDCHSGLRRQDLIAQDDGKGGAPRFVALLMGNEPVEGTKALSAEDKVKVILAASKGREEAPATASATQLAAR